MFEINPKLILLNPVPNISVETYFAIVNFRHFPVYPGQVIAVVKNMFRLPDLLTGDNIMFNSLKLL